MASCGGLGRLYVPLAAVVVVPTTAFRRSHGVIVAHARPRLCAIARAITIRVPIDGAGNGRAQLSERIARRVLCAAVNANAGSSVSEPGSAVYR